MKYNVVNNHKVPSLSKTKGFKPTWFALGFIFHFFSLPVAYLLYAIRYPRIDIIRKTSLKFALLGVVLRFILCIYFPAYF